MPSDQSLIRTQVGARHIYIWRFQYKSGSFALLALLTMAMLLLHSKPSIAQTEQDMTLQQLRKEAESGDPDAEFRLGEYLFVKVRTGDPARVWFKKAADKGHVVAMWWLGKDRYYIPENFEYLRRAAEGGYPPAQTLYARVAFQERHDISCEKYIDLLQKAANAGHFWALNMLAEEYGAAPNPYRCVEPNEKIRFQTLSRMLDAARSEGIPDRAAASVYLILAKMHQSGTGTEKDDVAAFRMFKEAADRGERNAAYLVGEMYWNGVGTSVDKDASRLYKKQFFDSMPRPVPKPK